MATADHLTELRNKYIHPSHSLFVFIESHVESLDVFWIVGDDHRSVVHLLGEALFFLALQADASLDAMEAEWALRTYTAHQGSVTIAQEVQLMQVVSMDAHLRYAVAVVEE